MTTEPQTELEPIYQRLMKIEGIGRERAISLLAYTPGYYSSVAGCHLEFRKPD